MTITASVQKQFFRSGSPSAEELIRIPPTVIMTTNLDGETPKTPFIKTKRRLNIWTVEEHERFLVGLERFPQGPWKSVAEVVGTKTTRQTMTHAQKYRQKIRRMSAGQAIKINKMPTMIDVEKEVEEEIANVDEFLAQLAASSEVDNLGDRASPMLEDWEVDALLADIGCSLDIDVGDLEINW